MSKKELLERIARAPADGRGAKTVAGAPAATGADAVTTRVSGRVVRRRQRNEPEPPVAAGSTPVVRRRTVDLDDDSEEVAFEPATAPEPIPEPEPERAAPPPEPVRAQRVEPEPAPVRDRTPTEEVPAPAAKKGRGKAAPPEEPVAVAAPPVREPQVEPDPEPVREPAPVEAAAPIEAPVSRLGSAVISPPPPKVEPQPTQPRPQSQAPVRRNEGRRGDQPTPSDAGARAARAEATQTARSGGPAPRGQDRPNEGAPQDRGADRPAAGAGSDRAPASDRGAGRGPARPEPVAARQGQPTGRPSPDASSTDAAPERPRFQGLGKAVVMPPPGYDPTNPGAFRRRMEQAAAPARPAPNAVVDDRRRHNDGPPGGGADDRQRRGRRSRAAPAMNDPMSAMRRRPRRKPAAGQRTSPGPKASKRRIHVDGDISVGQLAHELGVKAAVVIKELMGMGRMATMNDKLDLDTAALVATNFEYEVVNAAFQEQEYLQQVADDVEEEGAITRPPVVTIMGHVDHGKTTLLDAIRQAKVAAGEAGGITQHIGAYQVEVEPAEGDEPAQYITFIDTPGHAAFTAMRARGASVTDIVVIVVASDDGVQPQTEEAIAHARAAGVPIVVAVNKMDKPGASADPIKQRLSDLGLVPEDWGGDTMYVPVSALKRQGIDELLEAILLQSEVLELRANPERHAEGSVIEARLERGRGVVATLLVQKGTLKRGDTVVLGSSWGRVRAMMDYAGKQLKEAGPSTPVEIFGMSDMPEVGDNFAVVKNEKDARALADHRAEQKREAALALTGRKTAAEMFAAAEAGHAGKKEVLPIILKVDVQGSLEALKVALNQISIEGTELRILHAAIGDINESDVNLAAANGSLLIGFNAKPDAMARAAAERQNVKPELYDVIYTVVDRVRASMGGLLGPQFREVRQGSAEIRAVFSISKFGKIAGSYVQDGKVQRGNTARLLRNGDKIWEGKISTLKRFKDDVREVTSSYECGIGFEGYDEFEVGDIIETWSQEQIANIGS